MKNILKILNRFGFYHSSQVDLNFVLNKIVEHVGDPRDYGLNKKVEEQVFRDMSRVENINKFLNATLAADIQREFTCQDDTQRGLIKGAFGRTAYFKSGIMKNT